jgi:hypothetical protein
MLYSQKCSDRSIVADSFRAQYAVDSNRWWWEIAGHQEGTLLCGCYVSELAAGGTRCRLVCCVPSDYVLGENTCVYDLRYFSRNLVVGVADTLNVLSAVCYLLSVGLVSMFVVVVIKCLGLQCSERMSLPTCTIS